MPQPLADADPGLGAGILGDIFEACLNLASYKSKVIRHILKAMLAETYAVRGESPTENVIYPRRAVD